MLVIRQETASKSVKPRPARSAMSRAAPARSRCSCTVCCMNKHLWRHQISCLVGIRRCITLDLLAHGDTEISAEREISVTANANMLREFLDALKIDQVDLIGNDSGEGICRIFAALNPGRIRTLVLTNCDAHNNWPPEAFKPFVEMAVAGESAGHAESSYG